MGLNKRDDLASAIGRGAHDKSLHIFWRRGWDTAEIARAFGAPESAVANRLAVLLDKKHLASRQSPPVPEKNIALRG
ncbi:MAG: hypothetical protein ACRCXM_11495 [Beijerinckiaceae bacterium]